ncbi:MAG: hypothetical protein ABIT04_00405 [Novosphingobium sp.]
MPGIDIAIPSFGYKSSISICRTFGFTHKCKVTDGARFDGRILGCRHQRQHRLRRLGRHGLSQPGERAMAQAAGAGQSHPSQEARGKPMPERTAKANAAKSRVRARVEHVFAQRKDKMGPFIRTIGIKRAEAKITLAKLVDRI